ncbi:hypothetical protein [Pseudobacteroides cellulosolvens]|uniref:Uncharacterized protein n=2 Tax=Pseudobacteroides cellulosolvens TaxID=35825 RepID=A0A0L6JKQ9_9FIRM|nr:hypothetical protein [Pseudobacteroides cellulosolvens]KNY26345.1 hypothetical protein Bccel_1607 [Pseudobacteroides cellulosolvens ATCC 35603 = DSM 2933]
MNETLVERTNKYIRECGIKARFICETLNIDEPYFCRWRKGQKKYILKDAQYKALSEFLESKGY